jgi:hypothetical protein
MMKKSLASLCLLASFTSFSNELPTENIKVVESITFSNNITQIVLNSTATATGEGFFMPESKAKLAAIELAKDNAKEVLRAICVNGIDEDRSYTSDIDCTVTDKKENIVECSVNSNAACIDFHGIKSKPGLSYQIGNIAASTACLDIISEKGYNIDSKLIDNCSEVTNELGVECVEHLAKYNSLRTYAVGKCGSFESEHALNVLRAYTGATDNNRAFQRPGVPLINSFSKVDSEVEETCVLNLLKKSTINSTEVDGCLNEVQEETEEVIERAQSLWDRFTDVFSN